MTLKGNFFIIIIIIKIIYIKYLGHASLRLLYKESELK